MGNGLAALMGLLGGGGEGLYKGTSAGIEDQQKAALLAEKQRQFDEGQFTPTSDLPDFLRKLVPQGAGKVRNALIPAYTSEGEKLRQTEEAKAKANEMANALESNTLGGPAAGTPMTPGTGMRETLPNKTIQGLAPIVRAGEVDKTMPLIQDALKSQALAGRMQGMDSGSAGLVPGTLHSGNPLISSMRLSSTGTPMPYVRGAHESELKMHHANYVQSITQKASSGQELSPEEMANYQQSVAYLNTVHPDIRAADQTAVPRGGYPLNAPGTPSLAPGATPATVPAPPRAQAQQPGMNFAAPYGQPSAPQPAQAPQGNQSSYEEFAKYRRGSGIPEDRIRAEWDQLNSKTPTTIQVAGPPGGTGPGGSVKPEPNQVGFTPSKNAYKGPYQRFDPPGPPMETNQIGPRITKTAPITEIDKIRDQEFAINSMRNIADAIENMYLDDRQRLSVALKQNLPGALEHIPVIGKMLAAASQSSPKLALTPDQAEINTHVGHSQLRYENAMGGVRAAGSPQMYPIFQALLGNLGDVNAPTKLRGLASDLQQAAITGQRMMVENRHNGIALVLRPEQNPSGSRTPQRPPLSDFMR